MAYYQRQIRFGGPLTPAVKILIIINVILYITDALIFQGSLSRDYFAISKSNIINDYKFYQFITYGFFHDPTPGNFFHILFNMLMLWMFGGELERVLEKKRFLQLYFISILGGGVFSLFSGAYVIGASGAIMAILLGYAMMWPNKEILLFFIIPMKAKFLMGIIIILELSCLIAPKPGDTISHQAHLGGLLFGFLYLFRIIVLNRSYSKMSFLGKFQEYFRKKRLKRKQDEINRRIKIKNTVDQLLEKISREGMKSLSKDEHIFLKNASKELNKNEYEPFN